MASLFPNLELLSPLIAILAAAVAVKIFAKRGSRKYYPIGGTVFHMLLNFRRLYDYLDDIARKHTTFRILFLRNTEVYTSDPANIEYFLKTNFSNYGKGSYNHGALKTLLGDGIFTVDGEEWSHQRKLSSYEFSTRNLKEFSSGVFRDNAASLGRIVSSAADSNQTIEIQDLFMKATLDSVSKVMLGVDLDSMCGKTKGIEFCRAFDEVTEMIAYRYVDVTWRIKRFLNVGSEATLKKCMKVVDAYVYDAIQTKIEQMNKRPNDGSASKWDLLSRFLEINVTDPKFLRDIAMNFIIAGKDTTGGTLSWFFYMMCKHPIIQEKIVEEVREVAKFGENWSINDIATSVTEEALDKMHYLHAALTETIRLYPAIPVDGKVCFSDDTLPDGYSVKKGDLVSYMPYTMGRMKSLWGEDAKEFHPERFLDKNGIFQPQSSFKFTAFQAGRRICLGKDFAYRQMKVFSAVLLSAFSFKLADERKPVNYLSTLTLQIDGGLHLLVGIRRKQ